METWQAIILGTVQGATEFWPISSSGHLVILPWFFGWPEHELSFDVALHFGTLLAVVGYFAKDLGRIILGFFQSIARQQIKTFWQRMAWLIIVGSIPGILAGSFFEKQAETVLRHPLIIATTLGLVGIILGLADRLGQKRKEVKSLTVIDSILIGLSQALAIIPGISRAAITISAALGRGFKRGDAAYFSFILATPIIAGATINQAPDLLVDGIHLPDAIGILGAAVVGFLVIKFLLEYLRRGSYLVFVGYRVLLALLIVAVYLWRF